MKMQTAGVCLKEVSRDAGRQLQQYAVVLIKTALV